MTDLLEKAFSEASKLSSEEQDKFATWMLDELASEQRWESAFSTSGNALANLANEALAEHHAMRTNLLDPDKIGSG
jgi:hypothetical protein